MMPLKWLSRMMHVILLLALVVDCTTFGHKEGVVTQLSSSHSFHHSGHLLIPRGHGTTQVDQSGRDQFTAGCQNFKCLLEKAAGVYAQETSIPTGAEHLQKTIVATSCNYAYLRYLQNWMCHASRLGLKYLIHAQDEKLFKYLQSNVPDALVYFSTGYKTVNPDEHNAFGSDHFYDVTNNKLRFAVDVLADGYDMLFR